MKYFAITVVVIWLLLSGCSKEDPEPDAARAGASTEVPTNEQAAMGRAAAAVKSYRASITVELPNGMVERGTFATILPDRVHFVLSFAGGTMNNEGVLVGNNRYAKMGSTWTRPPPTAGLPRVLTATGGLDQLAAFRSGAATGSLMKGGTEAVDGRQCQLYRQTLAENLFEYCVSQNLPLRMKEVQGAPAVITFIFSDFDNVAEIREPI